MRYLVLVNNEIKYSGDSNVKAEKTAMEESKGPHEVAKVIYLPRSSVYSTWCKGKKIK